MQDLASSRLAMMGAVCPGDFNRDGGVDGADVEYFFERRQSGC